VYVIYILLNKRFAALYEMPLNLILIKPPKVLRLMLLTPNLYHLNDRYRAFHILDLVRNLSTKLRVIYIKEISPLFALPSVQLARHPG
jgi:hypothetical protein